MSGVAMVFSRLTAAIFDSPKGVFIAKMFLLVWKFSVGAGGWEKAQNLEDNRSVSLRTKRMGRRGGLPSGGPRGRVAMEVEGGGGRSGVNAERTPRPGATLGGG